MQVLHFAYEASQHRQFGCGLTVLKPLKPLKPHLRRMMCLLAWASGRPSRVVVSSAAGLIITVTDSEVEVIEREAGGARHRQTEGQALSHMMVDGGRSFCATATSAGLNGADLIRRC